MFKDWSIKKLGQVSEICSGFGFPKALQGKQNGDYPFGKVGVISNIVRNGGLFIGNAPNYIDKPDVKKLRAKPFPPGTIVFAKIGEAIRQNYYAMTTREMLFDNNVCGVIPNTQIIDPMFLLHFLNTVSLYPLASTTAVPSINKSVLESIEIPVPSLSAQHQIVARIKECMERVDEIKNLHAIATEEVGAITKSILYETWQSPDIASVEKIALCELGDITTGNTPSRKVPEYFGGNLPWVTPGDFNGRLIATGREFLSKRGLSESNARVVPEGSVLVVCIGATIGKTALAGCDLGINQQINAVTFNPEKVIPEFGYWACRALVPEIIDNASKNTLPILNKGRFSKLKIPVPSKETQERIAVQLNAAEAAVSEMRQELLKANTASAALRESILRKAFTGEL